MLEVKIKGAIDQFEIDATFMTEAGTLTALSGRSGAGKTTIINMIAGLVKPRDGRIAIDSDVLFDSAHAIDQPPNKRGVGYIFQDNLLFPHLTVKGNLCYGQNLTPTADRYLDFDEMVELLGLKHLLSRRPSSLSGGEKKRVAVGRALLANPRALLMDEPLAGLDMARKDEILPFIEQIRQQVRLPIVYVSHDIDDVLRLSDQIALIDKGRTVLVGPAETVANHAEARLLLGQNNPSTIVSGTVISHDTTFGLTSLETQAGLIRVPGLKLPPGSPLRLRLNARNISIALSKPQDISVLNVLPGVIESIEKIDTSTVDVKIRLATQLTIDARITTLAHQNLNLAIGTSVFALIKSVAVDRF